MEKQKKIIRTISISQKLDSELSAKNINVSGIVESLLTAYLEKNNKKIESFERTLPQAALPLDSEDNKALFNIDLSSAIDYVFIKRTSAAMNLAVNSLSRKYAITGQEVKDLLIKGIKQKEAKN